jgi:dihydroorotate dehydrogenase (NAD+) catalytic subunit
MLSGEEAVMPKYDLLIDPPLMNAAGSLGFTLPDRGTIDPGSLGAFVTNPISLEPRAPTRRPRLVNFPGGFLLHTGYPNPGLRSVLRRFAGSWERIGLPIIVHLLCDRVEHVSQMMARLERVAGIAAVELSLPPKADVHIARAVLQAAAGELPVILRLPLDQARHWADLLWRNPSDPLTTDPIRSGIAAISLGPPRGLLPIDQSELQFRNNLVHGRLYGPALYAQALATVHALAETGMPVIGAGGIYLRDQAETMLAAGAVAVQLDAVLWRGWIN